VTPSCAITPRCIKPSRTRERPHHSIPISPAPSRRFSPIHS
jgi:hypothetical protein